MAVLGIGISFMDWLHAVCLSLSELLVSYEHLKEFLTVKACCDFDAIADVNVMRDNLQFVAQLAGLLLLNQELKEGTYRQR